MSGLVGMGGWVIVGAFGYLFVVYVVFGEVGGRVVVARLT